jgi:hypothetical protein
LQKLLQLLQQTQQQRCLYSISAQQQKTKQNDVRLPARWEESLRKLSSE